MHTIKSPGGLALALVAVLALLVSACGSDSSSTSASSGSSSKSGASSDPSKAVVEGVPTLAELSKGTYSKPPTSSPPGAQGKSVWFISCGLAAPSCAQPAKEAGDAAKALGLDYHVADGKFNAGGGYAEAVRTAVAAKPDAILVYGVECDLAKSAFQEAKDQGILVMGVETPDCADTGGPKLFTASEKYSAKYPTTEALWKGYGAISAQYIINASGGKAKIINNASKEAGTSAWVDEGFRTELKKCSECEIVATVDYSDATLTPNGQWITGFRTALVQHPEATATYMPWDLMPGTLGAAKAIKESGHEIVAFGGQGASDGMDLARKGEYVITSARPAGWSAYAAVDSINRLLQNKPAVDQGIGFQYVDPKSDMGAAGTAFETSLDYRDAYKSNWGN